MMHKHLVDVTDQTKIYEATKSFTDTQLTKGIRNLKHQYKDQCVFVRTVETSYEAAVIKKTPNKKRPLKTAENFINFFLTLPPSPLLSTAQYGQEEPSQFLASPSEQEEVEKNFLANFCLF